MRAFRILPVAGLFLAALTVPPSLAEAAVKVSGYVQSRYVNDAARGPASDFLVRRARLKVSGTITENADILFQIDAAGSVTVKDGAVGWGRGGWHLQFGQRKVPFGFQILESSSVRLALERAKFINSLFPGRRDRGVFVFYAPQGEGLPVTLSFAIVNGNGPNKDDNNNHKNLVFRVEAKPKWGTVGASYYTGNFTNDSTGVTTAMVRSGFYLVRTTDTVEFQGEFVAGRERGQSVQGWYLQGAHRLTNLPAAVFVRRELFDPNRNAAADEYNNTIVGAAFYADKATTFTCQYQFVRDPATAGDDNSLGLQMQVKY